MKQTIQTTLRFAAATLIVVAQLAAGAAASAQNSSQGSVQGVIRDPGDHPIQGASIAVVSAAQQISTAVTDSEGHFAVKGLAPGSYTVQASATGFATHEQQNVRVAAGQPAELSVTLTLASVAEEVTVEAEADTSIAAQLSPVKAVLDAGSARTEITSRFISEFTSPVTDFSDIIQAAPGTVSWSSNGIGLGQAKIYFRGFVDDDYTMTWDGVPFEDANDPSHHSWAYVPAPAIGYVDFDRSPGTASDMGPANYGGSIHLFSPRLPSTPSAQFSDSYGSFNTNQIEGQFFTGLFGGKNPKANFWLEGHHMSSDGYQTFNYQQRTAASAKFTYKFSDRTNLALVGTSVMVDSNTPNNDPYRFQLAKYGDNFLMQNNQFNTDGSYNGLYYRYYTYHVPTNFEVITFTKDFSHGWRLETKPYTYSYSNHQHYNNNQYSDAGDDPGLASAPVSATSAINKMNQYNRAGEITTVSAASKYGVFRAGAWYEFTSTNRYQVKSDPRTWIDSPLISNLKFHERFKTQAVQPFAEYQLVAIPRLTLTAGVKDAYFNMWLKQWADGKTIGPLNCPSGATTASCPQFVTHDAGYNNVLPSVEANVRLQPYWSVYGQYGRGSIIPFSAVFDVAGAEVAKTPPPTVASTYQGGTVLKVNRFSMDADAFHIHFVNQYSHYTPSSGADAGFTYYYATPASDTNGVEAEGNLALGSGLSLFLNGTLGSAKYEAYSGAAATPTSPAVGPSTSAWVALAPHDTESIGLTYQSKGWDAGIFNKRIGSRWEDDGAYHQVVPLEPWWLSNLFINYTVRSNSFFDQSKFKLSINNLFDNHAAADIGAANSVSANGVLYTPSTLDTLELLPGRSVMVTFQIGLTPRER